MAISKPISFYYRREWRIFLISLAAIVVIYSIYFTDSISRSLVAEEEKTAAIWSEAQKSLTTLSEEAAGVCDLSLQTHILELNTTIPMILVDEQFKIIDAMNYKGKDIKKDADYFSKEVDYLRTNQQPIIIETEFYKNYLYYRSSNLISQLVLFPYIQLGLLAAFVLLSFLTWNAAKAAEQERVWVGMSKETAHQLGTPISSLIGWVENIRAFYPDDEMLTDIADEINKDIHLLTVVAERFSKIGAIPELKPVYISENLERYYNYIRQRASKKIKFDFPDFLMYKKVSVMANSLLLDWVIENLLKNALDAMGGEGEITVKIVEELTVVHIDFSDTGKGMDKKLYKKIFEAGFSTKKRGWGLGLSLCKRIIEEYHSGKIFVKYSSVGQGTIFRVGLKKNE
jgi:signal transduction histidine kinase